MYRLKEPHLPKYWNQLFNLHTVATKSTLQASHSTTYLVKGKKVMQQEFPLLGTNPTTNNQKDSSCLYEGKCIYSKLTELENTVHLLQRQIQDLRKDTTTNKNQWEYCSSHLNALGIPTDEPSMEKHQNWGCGNHYDS